MQKCRCRCGLYRRQKDAEAQQYEAEKEAAAIRAKGLAEAEALDKKLLQQYGATDISEVVDSLWRERSKWDTGSSQSGKVYCWPGEVDQKVGGGDELAENEDAVTEEGAYDTQTEDAGNTANEDVANEDAALEE